MTTKREQIVSVLTSELEALPSFKKVIRKLHTYEQLTNFASPQFPLICVVVGLPVPNETTSSRTQGTIHQIISTLDVELYIYLRDTGHADETISDLLQELWSGLLLDERKEKLVLGTTLLPESTVAFWDPFAAFKVTVSMKYVHNKGEI